MAQNERDFHAVREEIIKFSLKNKPVKVKRWILTELNSSAKPSEERAYWLLFMGDFHFNKGNTNKAFKTYRKGTFAYLRYGNFYNPYYIESIANFNKLKETRYKGEENRNISGSPHLGFHYSLKKFNFPSGNIGVLVADLNGENYLYETPFSTVWAHTIDLNLIGWYDNFAWYPFRSGFAANTYIFFSIRVGYTFMPNNPINNSGVSHLFELIGVDGGFKHIVGKSFFFEYGAKLVPFAGMYTNLGNIYFDRLHTMPSGNFVSGANSLLVQYFIGAQPYARAGFLLKKESPILSIDFTAGYNYNFTYASSRATSLDNTTLTMNGLPVNKKTFNTGGFQFGAGVTIFLN